MTKRNAKLFCFSFFTLFFSTHTFAQELFSLEQLDSVKVFTSLEDAIKSPLEVYRLELKKQKLKEIPEEVYQFKNLQYLDLSRNKLDTFPKQLATLSNLVVIVLNRNSINYLTESIGSFKNLMVLEASNNYLWEIDKSIGDLRKLEVLDLWANRLINLPESVQEIKSLKVIDMRVNPVKREVQEEIQEYLPKCLMNFSYDCKCY